MRRITVGRPAPSDSAACSVATSSFCSDAQTASTMNGTSTWTSATTTPVKVNIILTGSSIRPPPSSVLLSTPSLPSSTAHPSVRTTTDISSGPSTMTIDTARQRGDKPAQHIGLRHTDADADRGDQDRHAEGAQEDHMKIVVARNVGVVGQRQLGRRRHRWRRTDTGSATASAPAATRRRPASPACRALSASRAASCDRCSWQSVRSRCRVTRPFDHNRIERHETALVAVHRANRPCDRPDGTHGCTPRGTTCACSADQVRPTLSPSPACGSPLFGWVNCSTPSGVSIWNNQWLPRNTRAVTCPVQRSRCQT